MKAISQFVFRLFFLCALLLSSFVAEHTLAQNKTDKDAEKNNKAESIGGREHDDNILGVMIGMDVPTALESVFIKGERQPGEEKPDAKRNEGNEKKDIRVLYKKLKKGEMQILFAEGKAVREIVLDYASPPTVDELRLPFTGYIGIAISGERFDDRYSVGYSDNSKLERIWWRDEKTEKGYRIRVMFVAQKLTKAGAQYVSIVKRKVISITPGDEEKFLKTISQ